MNLTRNQKIGIEMILLGQKNQIEIAEIIHRALRVCTAQWASYVVGAITA